MSEMICKECGTSGEPARITKGSFVIELALWLCFLVPGLIYSLWRLSSRSDVCSCCGSSTLVPISSPVGKTLARQHQPSVPAAPARTSNAHATGAVLGRAFRRFVLRK